MPGVDLSRIVDRGESLYIGGQWLVGSGTERFAVVTPSTEETLGQLLLASESDINRAVAAARIAFDDGPWPRMSPTERAVYLTRIAKGLEARSAEGSAIWTSETGAVASFAQFGGPMAAGPFLYYAALAQEFEFEERHVPIAGDRGLLVREPVGVVAAILPWNGPLSLLAVKVAPALLAGCCIIIKMPPEAPYSGHLFAEVAEEAGLPSGVINVVTADRGVSEALVRHSGVDKVTFTGSTAAGKRIGALCAERVARCTLELGGKSAALVLDDYDVATAAASISSTATLLTGQVCASLTRIIVSDARHDQMVDALAGEFAKVSVGDPFDPAVAMGPLAMARQRDRVEQYIATGTQEGATLASGGQRPAHLNRGFYVEPTVFGNVTNDMTIAREEIFGPVLSVIRAKDEADAVRIANDSVFGLNASVFTNDPERAYQVARRLRSGTVGQNAQRVDFSIAFGGFKQSGIGREGGREGLLPFLETKTIILDNE